jgi:hypothetical protein
MVLMGGSMSKGSKACWLKTPPECPVRVPVMLSVELPSGRVEVPIGDFEGGDCGARARVAGMEHAFQQDGVAVKDCADAVLQDLALHIQFEFWIGQALRRVAAQKPVVCKLLDVVLAVLAGEADGEDRDALLALRGLAGGLGQKLKPQEV